MRARIFISLIFVLTPTLLYAQAVGGKAGAAGAFGAAPGVPHPLMQALDLDNDGTLSAKEIRAAVKSLKTLDANRDGKLTPGELAARARVGGMGKAAGAPGAAAGGAARGAGARGAAGGVARRGGAVGGFGIGGGIGNAGGGAGIRTGSGKGLPLSSRQMLAYDKNRDGKVTRQELPPQIWNLYSRFDVNRDGMLDRIELVKASAAGR